jgi:hypothetical protein
MQVEIGGTMSFGKGFAEGVCALGMYLFCNKKQEIFCC